METFTDDTVVALASFLSPHDMLSLALACKRFGDKHGADMKRSAAREERIGEVRQRTEAISLMEVAAHAVLHAKWTDEEKNALPRCGDESWIGLYQEFLSVFRLPLQFDKLVGHSIYYLDSNDRAGINYVEDTDKTKVLSNSQGGRYCGVAICSNIMRAGRHIVSFNFDNPNEVNGITLGIMRPTRKDITTLTNSHPGSYDLSTFSLKEYEILHRNNIDCCLMNTFLGSGFIRKRWKEWKESELAAMDEEQREQAKAENMNHPFHWEGMERSNETSFKIGMVLDLDEGTLDVYKNDRRLGTLMTGLVGEYCWVVTGAGGVSFSIER